MMDAFDRLLKETHKVCTSHPDLRAFCDVPAGLTRQDMVAADHPVRSLMEADPGTTDATYAPLRDAFVAAGPTALWRQTYRDTGIDAQFLDRFGCYALVGGGGAFAASDFSAFVVYMPAGLHYPWHHHPAEEIYLVIAGHATFSAKGRAAEKLRPGQTSFHATNQPHAMTTTDSPVMALVMWRGDLMTKPVWSAELP